MESETIQVGATIVGALVVVVWSGDLVKRFGGKTIHLLSLKRLAESEVLLRVKEEFSGEGDGCGRTYLKCKPLDSAFGDIFSICREFVREVVPARNKGRAQKTRPRRNAQAIAAQAL